MFVLIFCFDQSRGMKRFLYLFLAFTIGLVVCFTPFSHAQSTDTLIALGLREDQTIIPLKDQPFYDQLEIYDSKWYQSYFGKVTGFTPQETLLRFYVVMARVGEIIRDVSQQADENPGLIWGEKARKDINEAEVLFNSAFQCRQADDGSFIYT